MNLFEKRIVPLITKISLKKNRIKYDRLTLVSTEEEKLEYIRFYNPIFLFEDQTGVLEKISQKTIKFCINTPHNADYKLQNGYRFDDFVECKTILQQIISKSEDSEERKKVNKKNRVKIFGLSEIAQTLLKSLVGWYFLCKYKPIILGADRIPKNEGIAFVGNHRNKLDPVFISITSKRAIHFAALLRMFQGKEDLFSLKKNKLICTLSAKFISMMGALPIARPSDDNYEMINAETISKLTLALEYGCAVGFFPEGTINRTPEKFNVLPLKSNRIFRMAVETDSYVQPVSIIWIPENSGIKNRLIIIYSYPINTYKRNKKEVKDIWQETVCKNIDFANEIIREKTCTTEKRTVYNRR